MQHAGRGKDRSSHPLRRQRFPAYGLTVSQKRIFAASAWRGFSSSTR